MYEKHIKYHITRLLASLALLILWPVLLIIALAIKIEDPKGPVFFKQKRVGYRKEYFQIYKFRTMRDDTPHDVPTHLLDADQYITKVGRFLRKYSLDELPQLLNMVRMISVNEPDGSIRRVPEMCVVGPRPALWSQDDLVCERDKYGANDVVPGLTGWAQIHGRDELEIPVKAELDGYYVKHMSPLLDLRIILGTAFSVFRAEGVVEGGTGAMNRKSENTTPGQKKIMIITNHSYMLWRFRKELIQHLMEENEIVLVMPFVGHEQDFMEMGVKCIETDVDRRGINPVTDLKLMRAYNEILKTEKPDLVITYSIKPNIYGGLVCAKQNIPFYANVQGLGTAFQRNGLAQFVSFLYWLSFRKVEKVFFENETNAREFTGRHIISKEKEVILKGAGINLEEYTYELYPQHDIVRFLYLGRIMKEKGMDELFAAAEKLSDEGYEFALDLVGFYEDEYEEQVKVLEKKGIAMFHGFQEDPKPYYKNADCVVLPSYHEGMSNVILEAAATGRPVITSNIPGCREGVDMPKTGMLVKVKNTDSLYRAMKKFLELSPSRREKMGQKGREKMEREFEKGMVVEMTVREIG